MFVISEGECFVRGCVLVNVIDIGYFHWAYFYICCEPFRGFRYLSKLTSEEQRFHRLRLYTQKLNPADGIRMAKTSVPFITHPGPK